MDGVINFLDIAFQKKYFFYFVVITPVYMYKLILYKKNF